MVKREGKMTTKNDLLETIAIGLALNVLLLGLILTINHLFFHMPVWGFVVGWAVGAAIALVRNYVHARNQARGK